VPRAIQTGIDLPCASAGASTDAAEETVISVADMA
jgi:hypothetical protein